MTGEKSAGNSSWLSINVELFLYLFAGYYFWDPLYMDEAIISQTFVQTFTEQLAKSASSLTIMAKLLITMSRLALSASCTNKVSTLTQTSKTLAYWLLTKYSFMRQSIKFYDLSQSSIMISYSESVFNWFIRLIYLWFWITSMRSSSFTVIKFVFCRNCISNCERFLSS